MSNRPHILDWDNTDQGRLKNCKFLNRLLGLSIGGTFDSQKSFDSGFLIHNVCIRGLSDVSKNTKLVALKVLQHSRGGCPFLNDICVDWGVIIRNEDWSGILVTQPRLIPFDPKVLGTDTGNLTEARSLSIRISNLILEFCWVRSQILQGGRRIGVFQGSL